jgi:hypothetical protein
MGMIPYFFHSNRSSPNLNCLTEREKQSVRNIQFLIKEGAINYVWIVGSGLSLYQEIFLGCALSSGVTITVMVPENLPAARRLNRFAEGCRARKIAHDITNIGDVITNGVPVGESQLVDQ